MKSKAKAKPKQRPTGGAVRPSSQTEQASASLTAKLVRIGNSRGIRLPKAVIEQAGLKDTVELTVRDGAVILRSPPRNPRAGWRESFRKALAALPPDFLERELEEFADFHNFPNKFDEEDWTW